MNRKKGIVIVVSAMALGGLVWLESRREHAAPNARSINTQAQQAAEVASTPIVDAIQTTPVTAPVLNAGGLNEPLLDSVLQHISRGGFIADSPEFKRFLELAVADPTAALALLQRRFEAIPAHDTLARSHLFAALLEIGNAMKASQLTTDEFIRAAEPLISRQLADPERVLLPRQGYTPAEVSAMLHRGDFFYEGGQLYANTFTPKFMALATLVEARTDLSRAALARIGNDKAIDPKIRQIATEHLRRQ